MTSHALGTLERVELRDTWANEAQDFTPWLAREENLAILSETLKIELELEAQEQAVGPFRADLLCRDTGCGDWVLIENQLAQSNHRHLGQLLTYASGLEAVTIVWVAARFVEEHRATLDWLNKITDESFRFFAFEIELWKIGDSPPAPKFNVVARPNDWSRAVAQAARSLDDAEPSLTAAMQLRYWEALNSVLQQKAGPVKGTSRPRRLASLPYSIGRSRCRLRACMRRSGRSVRAELYLSGATAKPFFHLLRQQQEAVEKELGYALEWDEKTDTNYSRIAIFLHDVDPEDEADWPRQHGWLADRLNELHCVFRQRIRTLHSDESHGTSSEDDED